MSENSPANRSAEDRTTYAILLEIQSISVEIKDRLAAIEAKQLTVDSAFMMNDLGKPDYDGHRKEHITFKKQETIVENYKFAVTKKILTWGAVGIVTLIGSSLVEKVIHFIKVLPT
ncbi:MAG: hypothetical protein QX189_00085 [Methylococcales bacterium]